MILTEIKHYLSTRHCATLDDLSIHFDTDPCALRAMLQLWIQKEKIRMISSESGCGSGCGKCTCAPVETYQWVQ